MGRRCRSTRTMKPASSPDGKRGSSTRRTVKPSPRAETWARRAAADDARAAGIRCLRQHVENNCNLACAATPANMTLPCATLRDRSRAVSEAWPMQLAGEGLRPCTETPGSELLWSDPASRHVQKRLVERRVLMASCRGEWPYSHASFRRPGYYS